MNAPYNVNWYPDSEARGLVAKFTEGLTDQCAKKLQKLKHQLSYLGPRLAGTAMFKHLSGDIWELRDLCDGGALRIYTFRSGTTFFMTCGEVKSKNKPDPTLLFYAQQCSDEHKRKS